MKNWSYVQNFGTIEFRDEWAEVGRIESHRFNIVESPCSGLLIDRNHLSKTINLYVIILIISNMKFIAHNLNYKDIQIIKCSHMTSLFLKNSAVIKKHVTNFQRLLVHFHLVRSPRLVL